MTAQLEVDGGAVTVTGSGNGPIAAFVEGLSSVTDVGLDVVDYTEHALGAGASAVAVAYVETTAADGTLRWGGGHRPQHHHRVVPGRALGPPRTSRRLTINGVGRHDGRRDVGVTAGSMAAPGARRGAPGP